MKQYVGGMIGGFLGVFIDIAIGFLGGFPWFGLIGTIIGIILGSYEISNNANSNYINKEEQKRQKFDNYISYYKNICKKLPQNTIVKLRVSINYLLLALGATVQDSPDELVKLGGALAMIQKEGVYGNPTYKQQKEIDKLVDRFCFDLETFTPIAQQTINEAANKGLNFGVIGDAVDVGVYTVMNTMEKKKNLRTAIRATNKLIDKKVRSFASELLKILMF